MATATRRVVRTMPQMFIETVDVDQGKLKVAAYARVSTEKEEQERPLWALQKLGKFKKCVSQMH